MFIFNLCKWKNYIIFYLQRQEVITIANSFSFSEWNKKTRYNGFAIAFIRNRLSKIVTFCCHLLVISSKIIFSFSNTCVWTSVNFCCVYTWRNSLAVSNYIVDISISIYIEENKKIKCFWKNITYYILNYNTLKNNWYYSKLYF